VNNETVLNAMKKAGKPVKSGEKELTKIFKELKSDGKIISPKRCYYSLPE